MFDTRKTKGIQLGCCIIFGMLSGCLDSVTEDNAAQAPESNSAPSIGGTPPGLVLEGQDYSFVPSATDPDNDPLEFSVRNRPGWAAFAAETGGLTGSPTVADIGHYPDIRISVTDGQLESSLAAFSIDVAQTADGTITISITAPTQNVDGSPLMDLTAYRIYYGESAGDYSNNILIDNPGISTYVIENLVPGQYFLVATAINSAGVESDYSNSIVRMAN